MASAKIFTSLGNLTNRMWFLSVVCTLIDNDTRHHSGQNAVGSRGAAEWVRNNFFTTITNINVLTTENTDSDFKLHELHYANELLVRIRLSFQKLRQTRLICRNNTHVLVVGKSTDHNNPNFVLFFTTTKTSKQMFFFRAQDEKDIARHIDASSVVWTYLQRQISQLDCEISSNCDKIHLSNVSHLHGKFLSKR